MWKVQNRKTVELWLGGIGYKRSPLYDLKIRDRNGAFARAR